MATELLTPLALTDLAPGKWASDTSPDHARGQGRLQARKTSKGVAFYYRFTGTDGQSRRIALGTYDERGRRGGLSLAMARDRAGELTRRYRAGDRDLHLSLAEEIEARTIARAQRQAEQAAEAEARAGTLGVLLMGYRDHLEAQGKTVTARDVTSLFNRHVLAARPALWARPAREVTTEDVVALVARLREAGHKRSADKLRSFIRAAYALAAAGRESADVPAALVALGIRENPAAGVRAVKGSRGRRERTLSVAELRAYWRRARLLAPTDAALLTLHLLTAGQRVRQLARVQTADWDRDADVLTLRDPKGRREEPRLHFVPLLPDVVAAINTLTAPGAGPFLFTVDGGLSSATYDQLADRIARVADAMVAAGEVDSRFTAGDLRRSVETRLAALGVPQEVRAELLSHGLAGVQKQSYDRHTYLDEKRQALHLWLRMLSGEAATVTALPKRRSAK